MMTKEEPNLISDHIPKIFLANFSLKSTISSSRQAKQIYSDANVGFFTWLPFELKGNSNW